MLPRSAAAVIRAGGGPWHGMSVGAGASGNPVMTTGSRHRQLGTASYLRPVEDRIAWMDRARLDVQVLSVSPPLFGYDLAPEDAVSLACDVNDDIADLVAAHPTRFRGLAVLPLGDPDEALTELDRAMTTLGMVGVELGTNVNGLAWDDPALFPVLEAAERLGALVFLHPNDVRATAMLRGYHLTNLIGNPLETTAAAAALIFGGVLDRLPRLRIALSHGGGYLSAAIGRFDHGHAVRPEARVTCPQPPSAYASRFLVDALVHSPRALRQVIDTLGIDRVVLGTDHPADMGSDDPVTEIESNDFLTAEEKAAVLGANLERELGLLAPA